MTTRAALERVSHGLELAAKGIRELLSAPDPDEWVDQVHSPLGRRRHCELARRGALPGARKVQGRWLVRRKALDAYIEGGAEADTRDDEVAVLNYRAPVRRKKR